MTTLKPTDKRLRRGVAHHRWKGGRIVRRKGYVHVYAPDHPNAHSDGYVAEHVLVASRALGKALPGGAVVHHRNGNKQENVGPNLIICQDEAYHQLLHARERAYRATGDANARTCCRCKKYGGEIVVIKSGQAYHRCCEAAYRRRLKCA